MGFSEYSEKTHHRTSEAYLSVGPGTPGYLTVAAVREYYRDVDEITYLTDVEYSRLGIHPGPRSESSRTYTLSGKDGGASIALTTVLAEYGITREDIESTHHLALEYDDDAGFPVVDLSPLVAEYTQVVPCPECGKRCKSESGVKSHHTRTHDDEYALTKLQEMDPDDLGGPTPAGDDSWRDLNEKAQRTRGEGQ